MPEFQYIAVDERGSEQTGTLTADDSNAVVAKLKEQGLFPTSVALSTVAQASRLRLFRNKTNNRNRDGCATMSRTLRSHGRLRRFNLNLRIGSGVKSKLLTEFTRQLATLIDAGMPLLRGLRLLDEQERNPVLKRAIRGIAEAVEGGGTLSESMGLYPRLFSKLYVNMVRAGEVAGALETVLNRLAEFQEKAQKIKGKVLAAMVYPSVVMGVSVIIVGFLVTFIVPRFQEIFSSLLEGKPLPGLTLLLVAFSDAIRHHALATLASVAGLVVLLRLVAKTRKGRFAIDALKLRLPLFGKLVRKVSISRFTRTLGTLISSGVPILQALLITRDTSGNQILARAIERVHDAVKEGESIVQPLKASHVFPPVVVGMIGIGEETGVLPEMLMKIAENYDNEVDNTVSALTSIIEPLVIGTIVIALFLPLIVIVGGGIG
ncbi:MAG: type II secretion system F family protein [Verrucomicrobiae bacterium]|nr:type II secretion system F family protein [Verrucomicrobiae bacterium]